MRWLEPEITAPAAAYPVTLDEAKGQVGEDTNERDDLITNQIKAACQYVEGYTGLALYTRTVKLRAFDFDCRGFVLPAAPVTAVTSITYIDSAGAEQTLDPAVYDEALYGLSPTIALAYGQSWPSVRCGLSSVVFTVTAGYAAGECPDPIKQAVLLIVGDWFENREQSVAGSISTIPMVAVESLLTNYRRHS